MLYLVPACRISSQNVVSGLCMMIYSPCMPYLVCTCRIWSLHDVSIVPAYRIVPHVPCCILTRNLAGSNIANWLVIKTTRRVEKLMAHKWDAGKNERARTPPKHQGRFRKIMDTLPENNFYYRCMKGIIRWERSTNVAAVSYKKKCRPCRIRYNKEQAFLK